MSRLLFFKTRRHLKHRKLLWAVNKISQLKTFCNWCFLFVAFWCTGHLKLLITQIWSWTLAKAGVCLEDMLGKWVNHSYKICPILRVAGKFLGEHKLIYRLFKNETHQEMVVMMGMGGVYTLEIIQSTHYSVRSPVFVGLRCTHLKIMYSLLRVIWRT